MRYTLARLATQAKYLTPGNPTGLAGLLTHPSPRAELIATYSATLAKLAQLPSHSSYRTSVEALTKHRLAAVEAVKPACWDEWNTKAQSVLQKYPDLFRYQHKWKPFVRIEAAGKVYISEKLTPPIDEDAHTYIGENLRQYKEGAGGKEKLEEHVRYDMTIRKAEEGEHEWVAEPKLDAEQIIQLEETIAGGLIEEVIQVAKGELKLVDTMIENQVWEELQDKAPQGQWEYFARDRHTGKTQEAPKAGN